MRCIVLLVRIVTIGLFTLLLIVQGASAITIKPTAPTGEPVKGYQWLFVIGINTYLDWPRLQTAVNDAKSLRDVLLERYHFEPAHVVELYDEQATRRNILAKLRYLARTVGEEDSLVIFYAGHGHLDSITKEGSWIPVESGTKDASAWISNHDIRKYLHADAIKAKHILLISDSCFAGDFFRGKRGKLPEVNDRVIKKAYDLSSRQAITSGGLEPVSDAGFGNNSVFSYFLIKTLKENQKPFLIPSDLFPNIKAGVAYNAEQFPRLGHLQGTGGQEGGELVLFLKQNYKLKQLSAQTSAKQAEFERLQQMQAQAEAAKAIEAAEIATREKEMAELDAKIEAMQRRLGTTAVRQDDSLDAMLAMVKQKEAQAAKLDQLRKQREVEETKRKAEIERLQHEQDEKTIALLKPEVEKYKHIIGSKYGASMKDAAWKSLVAKCPPGWTDGVNFNDIDSILQSPSTRKKISEEKKKNMLRTQEEQKQQNEKLIAKRKIHVQLNEIIDDPSYSLSKFNQVVIYYTNRIPEKRIKTLIELCEKLGITVVTKLKLIDRAADYSASIQIAKRMIQKKIGKNAFILLGFSSPTLSKQIKRKKIFNEASIFIGNNS